MGLGVSSVVRSTVACGTDDEMLGLAGITTAASPLLYLRSAFDILGFLISDDFLSTGSSNSTFSYARTSILGTIIGSAFFSSSLPLLCSKSATTRSKICETLWTCCGSGTLGLTF